MVLFSLFITCLPIDYSFPLCGLSKCGSTVLLLEALFFFPLIVFWNCLDLFLYCYERFRIVDKSVRTSEGCPKQ